MDQLHISQLFSSTGKSIYAVACIIQLLSLQLNNRMPLQTLAVVLALFLAVYFCFIISFRIATAEYIRPVEALHLAAEVTILSVAVFSGVAIKLGISGLLLPLIVAECFRVWSIQVRGPIPIEVNMHGKICVVTGEFFI
mmetsp:Transcript_15776/g.19141  ORF Transcript_15776/g.19141 Transcript_15776/m.19141 type:complete len:139 (-) Transcript_15776:113-529(-)